MASAAADALDHDNGALCYGSRVKVDLDLLMMTFVFIATILNKCRREYETQFAEYVFCRSE